MIKNILPIKKSEQKDLAIINYKYELPIPYSRGEKNLLETHRHSVMNTTLTIKKGLLRRF